MTNDLNTLSGALLEMKDELIYQLGQKGVTASYSSTDGLLGLIGRIADIQTGGGGSCYHIEFQDSSYIAVGGSCTVSVFLQSNYAPLSGATVTFTSSTSTSTTATTDANGIATATITFSASTTLTATYSNVSDTASVNVTTYLIDDDASSDNRSTIFGTGISLRNSGTCRVDYISTSPVHYEIVNTKASAETFLPYAPLNAITNSFKLTVRSKNKTSTKCAIGLYYYLDNNNWGGVKTETTDVWVSDKTNGTFHEQSYSAGQSTTTEVINEFIYNATNSTLTVNQYNTSMVLKKTQTMNIPVTITSSVKWGTSITWDNNATRNVYNIRAEYI